MPILENIKKAEKQAEDLRLKAEENAKEELEKVKEEAEAEAEQIVLGARENALANDRASLELIGELEKETTSKIKRDKEALDKLAKKNSKQGLNYILSKVFEK